MAFISIKFGGRPHVVDKLYNHFSISFHINYEFELKIWNSKKGGNLSGYKQITHITHKEAHQVEML